MGLEDPTEEGIYSRQVPAFQSVRVLGRINLAPRPRGCPVRRRLPVSTSCSASAPGLPRELPPWRRLALFC